MLYKPSNMLPSAFGGLGSEVIDASVENDFSMTINGNAFVNAYQLIIYENTEASTSVYDTGVVELSTPFAPSLPSGRKQTFTVTVPTNNPSDTPHTHMANDYANAYKWVISLWETYTSGTPTLTKITSDENVAVARTPAAFDIDVATAPATITSRYNQWKATLSGISPIMQFNWKLYEVVDGVNELIYDTGWIFQAPQVWFEYSGLVSGKTYSVQAQAITQDGVTYTTTLATSAVTYDTLTSSGATSIVATEGGLIVGMSGIQYIVGQPLLISGDTASTNYSILDDYLGTGEKALQLGSDTYVKFESSETFSLDLEDTRPDIFGLTVVPYTGANVTLATLTSEDATQSRVLKHAGFEAGLIPNGDSLEPDGDTLTPSFGVYGQFEYTINGTTYTLPNSQLPLYQYIVILRNSSFAIYEYLAGGGS
jgi:hypothetical protein